MRTGASVQRHARLHPNTVTEIDGIAALVDEASAQLHPKISEVRRCHALPSCQPAGPAVRNPVLPLELSGVFAVRAATR